MFNNGWSSGSLSGVDIATPQAGDTIVFNPAVNLWQNSTKYIGGSPASLNVDFVSTANYIIDGTVNVTPTSPFQPAYPNIVSSAMNTATGLYTFPVSGVYYYEAGITATPTATGGQLTAMNAVVNTAVGNETREGIVIQQGAAYVATISGHGAFNENNNLQFQVSALGTQSSVDTHVSIFFLYAIPKNNTFVS